MYNDIVQDIQDAIKMIDDYREGNATKDDLLTVAINLEEAMMRAKRILVRYKAEIDRFFREEDFSLHDREKGHVWIAGKWRKFQALTVEPPEGGQYEIAVRFPLESEHVSPGTKYSGYIAYDGFIVGVNTDGH